MAAVRLTGITWDHSRGFVPLVATAQRYYERYGTEIVWEKRSLQAFADRPIQDLAKRYDLMIIDHPFVGYAARHPVLRPLDELLPAPFLDEQAGQSVGASHVSYQAGGHQWALATDAATPVASYRADLMARHALEIPSAWDELLELAGTGMVAVPAIAIDSLMNLLYILNGLGAALFDGDRMVDPAAGVQGLDMLRELVHRCSPRCAQRNPILTYEALASRDDVAYCPFAYAYSNYGRRGYADHLLSFADVVRVSDQPAQTVLGGTGLAISASTEHADEAARYVAYVNAGLTQRTLYLEAGGQPGHRSAWKDARADELTHRFFSATLATHDRAYLRPTYDGYIYFQDRAGPIVRSYLDGEGRAPDVVKKLNELYRTSLRGSDALEG